MEEREDGKLMGDGRRDSREGVNEDVRGGGGEKKITSTLSIPQLPASL